MRVQRRGHECRRRDRDGRAHSARELRRGDSHVGVAPEKDDGGYGSTSLLSDGYFPNERVKPML
jgi:hypothetical protein